MCTHSLREGYFCTVIPWVNVHQKKQRLYCYNVYPFAMKTGNLQDFSVSEAKNDERKQEAGSLKHNRECGKLRPSFSCCAQVQGARRICVAVACPRV